MRPTQAATTVRRAAARGASPDELAELVRQLTEQAVAEATTKAKRRRTPRDRGAEGHVGQVRRTMAAMVERRLADDPQGVGNAVRQIAGFVKDAEDKAGRAMRASGQYSWPEIARTLGISEKTAFNRWSSVPGGLPRGGQTADRR